MKSLYMKVAKVHKWCENQGNKYQTRSELSRDFPGEWILSWMLKKEMGPKGKYRSQEVHDKEGGNKTKPC